MFLKKIFKKVDLMWSVFTTKQTKKQRDTRKPSDTMGMFIAWMVVMVTQVDTSVQAQQDVYMNDVQVFGRPVIPR